MNSWIRKTLAVAAALVAGALTAHAQVSLRGFYTASINSSLTAVIAVHNNNSLDAYLFDSSQQQVGKAVAPIDASGNFSITGELGYSVTGTLAATGASAQITGQVSSPSWSGPVSFTAPRSAWFGVGGGGTSVISGRFIGKASSTTSSASTNLYILVDANMNLYLIHEKADGTFTGGLGTVVPNADNSGGTFTYTTVTGNAGSGTFTTDAFTMTGTLTNPSGSYTFTVFRDAAANRLGNISTRGFVGTGQNVLISGFIIDGGPKLVLIRALGPGLSQYGITSPLPDPEMTLYKGQKAIGTNTGWQNQSSSTLVSEIQSTQLSPPSTSDSAMLVQLEAGAYTVTLQGASGDTGTALIEVYEVLLD
jgi:hypothetical protein